MTNGIRKAGHVLATLPKSQLEQRGHCWKGRHILTYTQKKLFADKKVGNLACRPASNGHQLALSVNGSAILERTRDKETQHVPQKDESWAGQHTGSLLYGAKGLVFAESGHSETNDETGLYTDSPVELAEDFYGEGFNACHRFPVRKP